VGGRDPGLGEAVLDQQLAQQSYLEAIGLGATLAIALRTRLRRLREADVDAGPPALLHDETSAGHRADRDSHRLAGEARKEIAERQPRRRANATGRDSPSLCPAHPGRTNVQGEKDRREILRARLTGEPILSAGSGSLPYACDSFPPLIGRSGGGYRRAQLARRGNRGHETTSSGARAAEGACSRWSVWEPVRRRRRGVPAPRRRARAQDGGGVTTP
jgi:hypothetical protein